MNISKRDQGLLLIVLGLVVVLAAYFGVYQNFSAKADAASAENSGLQPRLQELEDYYSNLPVYEAGIEEISDAVDKEIKGFPSDVRSEDMIVYGNDLEKKLGVTIDSMSFSTPEMVSQFSVPHQDDNGQTVLVPYAALSSKMDVTVKMSYNQMLDFIDYIYKKSTHTTLDNISVSYDSSTGVLTGSASMMKYFMSDSEYEYEATKLPDTDKGASNPFGTLKTNSGSSSN